MRQLSRFFGGAVALGAVVLSLLLAFQVKPAIAGDNTVNANGTYVEAENYNSFGSNFSNQSGSGNGGMYLNATTNSSSSRSGNSVEYKLNFPETGTYYIWFRGNSNGASGDNSLWYGVDNNYVGSITFPTNSNYNWANTPHSSYGPSPARVTISSAGEHTVNVWARENGLKFDGFYLTKSSSSSIPGGTSVGIPTGAVEIFPTGTSDGTTSSYGNQAQGKTASASDDKGSRYRASKAVDGSTSSYWRTDSGDDEWLKVDLGQSYRVDKVVIKWGSEFAEDYEVAVSTNNASWTRLKDEESGDGGTETVTFSERDVRYVRVLCTKEDDKGYRISELEVYGQSESTPLPEDCAGVPGGNATLDNCGTCDADPTNDCTEDCNGVLGGDAVVDNCGTCDNNPSNDCNQDCAGIWGGDAVVDNCGTCDNDPLNDCINTGGGNTVNANGTYVEAENHNHLGDNFSHQSGSGNGDEYMNALTTSYNSVSGNSAEYKLSFAETGTYYIWFRGNSNGSSGDNSLWYGVDGSMVGNADFSTSNGYRWAQSRYNNGPSPMRITISSTGDHTINVWARENGLKYDGFYLTKSSSSTIPGGTTVGIPTGAVEIDPSNTGGGNPPPDDCAGVPGGSATLDNCGTCDSNPSNDCTQDCAGTWGGSAVADNCGTCDADSSNDCTQDCAGAWGGSAVTDNCGTCDADPSNDCVQDCAGAWGGDAVADNCGTCDNDASNDCTEDCAGTWGGSALADNCGTCDTDPTNDCTEDCAGTWGGSALADNCGTCDTDPTNDCTEDCAGTWGGSAVTDNCGTCDTDPTNDCTEDCAGTWGGSALADNCGTCDTDPTNDCAQDCAGTWGGSALADNCGTCDSDATNDCTTVRRTVQALGVAMP